MGKRFILLVVVTFVLLCCTIFNSSMNKVYADMGTKALLTGYSFRNTLSEVPEDKTFTLSFNSDINSESLNGNTVDLVENTTALKVPVKLVQAGLRKVMVIPQQKLKYAQTYYLVLHNSFKSINNLSMKQGVVFTIKTIPQSEIDFIKKVSEGAQKTYKEYGIFPSVTIAQAILESGWGTSDKAKLGNNLFGIKADTSWTGNRIDLPTQEWDGVKMVMVTASWRAYPDWAASIEDHSKNMVLKPTYSRNGVFSAKNYKEQITAIKKAGYATDPNYVQHICGIIDRLHLWTYDPSGQAIN